VKFISAKTQFLITSQIADGSQLLGEVERAPVVMNTRPRKTLGWLNPTQALQQLLSGSPSQPSVASTD